MFTYFFNANHEKVYSVVVVPVYISRWDPKKAKPLMPGENRDFIETILSEIPDDWSGEFKYELWDAGDMPKKRWNYLKILGNFVRVRGGTRKRGRGISATTFSCGLFSQSDILNRMKDLLRLPSRMALVAEFCYDPKRFVSG